jgi:hypothetical protein
VLVACSDRLFGEYDVRKCRTTSARSSNYRLMRRCLFCKDIVLVHMCLNLHTAQQSILGLPFWISGRPCSDAMKVRSLIGACNYGGKGASQ